MIDAFDGGLDATFADVLGDVLVRTISEGAGKGLLLLPFPTGTGKSTAVKEMAIPALVRGRAPGSAPIVYLTPQHKNLPSAKEMRGFLEASGVDVGERDVLYLKSVPETLSERATDALLGEMPFAIRKSVEADRFFSLVKLLKSAADQGDLLGREFSDFRRRVKRELPGDGWEERLEHIERDEEWKWLGELWPQVFARRAKVLIMTAKKFFLPFDTLVEPARPLGEYEWMRGSIIFADEFDAVKAELLDVLAGQAADRTVDLPGLVRSLNSGVDVSKLPASMFSGEKGMESRRSVGELRKRLDEVAGKLRIDYAYKAQDGVLNQSGLFSFDGTRGGHSSIKTYHVLTNERTRENMILERKADGSRYLWGDVVELRAVLKYAQRVIVSLLRDRHGYALSGLHDVALDNEIHSFLRAFGVEDPAARAMMVRGVREKLNSRARSAKGIADSANIYDQGFGTVTLTDSTEHRFSTDICVHSMDESPEARLVFLMERALVVGISATAGIDSPICNFDLTWLREQVPELMLRLDEGDEARLREAFDRHVQGYEDGRVEISADALELSCAKDGGGVGLARQIVDGARVRGEVANLLQKVIASSEGDRGWYAACRYARVARAYQYYLDNVSQGVFLCVTTAAPKAGPGLYSAATIERLVGCVRRDRGLDEEADAVRFIEGSLNFQDNYDGIVSRLGVDYDSVFICASYGSLSTGVNLQYAFDGMETRTVGSKVYSDKVDVAGVYLDRVTNKAPIHSRLSGDEYEKNLLTCLFEIRELLWRGDISPAEVDKAQGQLVDNRPRRDLTPLTETRDVRRAVTATIVQMVGRMCRTQKKAPHIHVLFDRDLVDRCDPDALGDTIVGPETRLLLDRLRGYGSTREDAQQRLERLLAIRGMSLAAELQRRVRKSRWSEEDMREWDDMRMVVLSCPCPTDEDLASIGALRHYYGEVPEGVSSYGFWRFKDYSICEVSFVCDEDHPASVSDQAARLDVLGGVDVTRRLFESRGWPLSWRATGHMMCPSLFTNVYLGAIGEQAGKAILEAYVPTFSLRPITDGTKFEKFDFVVDGTDVYIDFKNWSVRREREDDLAKIARKMVSTEASCCLVVNLMAGDEFAGFLGNEVRTNVFEVPYLIDAEGKVASDRIIELREWLRKKGVSA